MKYFRQLLADTTKKLTDLCTKWEAKLTTVPKNLSNYDDVEGNIRTVIGQAHLIMDRKGRFPQFEGLINNCEFGLGEKETTCMDLQVQIKASMFSFLVIIFTFFRDSGK